MPDPLDAVAWPLETPRLRIRRITPDDVAATWRYRQLPEVGFGIGWYTQDPDEYRELFLDPARQASVLAIELLAAPGTVIGDVVLKVEDGFAQREARGAAAGLQAEIGWSLDPAYGGQGYATEAVRAVIDAAFAQLGIHRIQAFCLTANTPSWRLMERLGMRREMHLVRSDLHRSGEWMDSYGYALLADEWPDAAAARAVATDPLAAVSWPIRTDRLSIRRVRPDDVEYTWRYRQLPEVGEYIGWWSASFDEYAARQALPDRGRQMLTIELPGDDGPQVIGDILVRVEDGWAQHPMAEHAAGTQAELGWNLDPAFAGQGYATEAVRAVIDACFTQLGLRRVHAGCFADNEPSWRLMERVGMRREEHSHKTGLLRSGQWADGLNYGLLAENWNP